MLRFIPASGFVARNGRPARERPDDWIVWHFTHRDNLADICRAGSLLPASSVNPARSVANDVVKGRRTYAVTPDGTYPPCTVHDHVPFYIAAKSPMLFAVTSPGTAAYKAHSSDLVFLGAALGELHRAGLTWCVSNGNAASGYTAFSREMGSLGDFIDFDLMCEQDWRNTADDPFRKGRRAAECLVLGSVPLELVSVVVTKDAAGLRYAQRLLEPVGGARHYCIKPEIFFF